MKKIANSQVLRLWNIYKNIKFRWTAEKLAADRFVIVTAFNPKSVKLCSKRNKIRHQKLVGYLTERRLKFALIECGNVNFSYSELSVAIQLEEKQFDLKNAINLSSRFGQNAIYMVAKNQLYLQPVLLRQCPTEAMGEFVNYTTQSL